MRPLIGWISGTDVADIGKVAPEVISGQNRLSQENAAVVMHIGLPADKQANINIVNIFKQGSGDVITFPEKRVPCHRRPDQRHAEELRRLSGGERVDIKLPLVADYSGAMINTSFQEVDKDEEGHVLRPGLPRGRIQGGAPVADYVTAFESPCPDPRRDSIAFSCNCILNYLYSDLEGKRTGNVTGPITFGEIAYQLLNQTLAYVTIQKSGT